MNSPLWIVPDSYKKRREEKRVGREGRGRGGGREEVNENPFILLNALHLEFCAITWYYFCCSYFTVIVHAFSILHRNMLWFWPSDMPMGLFSLLLIPHPPFVSSTSERDPYRLNQLWKFSSRRNPWRKGEASLLPSLPSSATAPPWL